MSVTASSCSRSVAFSARRRSTSCPPEGAAAVVMQRECREPVEAKQTPWSGDWT